MIRVIKQTVRGCTDLPYVGPHPGTAMVAILIAGGALAGAEKGVVPALIGAAVMSVAILPFYLHGAYERAKISDSCSEEPRP